MNTNLDMTELPYSFDLFFDMKFMFQVEQVCNGDHHVCGTHVTPNELYKMFTDHQMEIPHFLKRFATDLVGDDLVTQTIENFHKLTPEQMEKVLKCLNIK
jgi:hypothetical protein